MNQQIFLRYQLTKVSYPSSQTWHIHPSLPTSPQPMHLIKDLANFLNPPPSMHQKMLHDFFEFPPLEWPSSMSIFREGTYFTWTTKSYDFSCKELTATLRKWKTSKQTTPFQQHHWLQPCSKYPILHRHFPKPSTLYMNSPQSPSPATQTCKHIHSDIYIYIYIYILC